MKKIILLFTLTLTVVGGANAKTIANKTASFGTPTGATYSSDIFAWTSTSGQYMQMFTFSAGDLLNYTHLKIKATKTSGSEIHYRIQFRASSGSDSKNVTNRYETSDSELSVDLSTIANLSDMQGIYLFCDNSETGSITIKESEVYLVGKEYEAMDITTPIAGLNWYKYDDNSDYSATSLTKQLNNSLGQNAIIYGPSSANATTAYFDVTGYDIAKFTLTTPGTAGIRLMYNTDVTTIETNTTNLVYSQSLNSISKIATIKTKNVSGISNISISDIDFIKSHDASSTTAFSIAASTSSTVSYDREFPTTYKSTVCLPFALTADEVTAAGKFYELSSVDGTTLHFTEVSTTEAYKPYVFEASTANPFANLTEKAIVASEGATTSYTVGNYTFQGTLAHQTVPDGAYGYNSTNGTFSKASGSGVTIDAFRAYITSSSSARSLDANFGDGTTGIEKVKRVENNYDSIYNLSGQTVGANYKGIVIKNGKKMIQK